MKIFLICPVRQADSEQRAQIVAWITKAEAEGNSVYYPALHTNQADSVGYQICSDNLAAIRESDVVAIYYDANSKGTLFDLGAAFALGKPLMLANKVEPTEGKSFANMIFNWAGGAQPAVPIPASANRVLSFAEVLALPEGARVWVEHTKGYGTSRLYEKHTKWRGFDLALVDERGEYWGIDTHIPETAFGKLYRVWSLPQEPTQSEKDANPWEKGAPNA